MTLTDKLTAIANNQTPNNPQSVKILYRKLSGEIQVYEVEPTNVKVTKAGVPLLVGYKSGTTDIRSFHIGRIIAW